MRIVYLNYFYSSKYANPEDWLQKIKPITAVAEILAKKHTVISIEQIDYQGQMLVNGVDYQFTNFYKRKTFFPFRLNLFVKHLQPDVVIVHGTVFPLQTILLRLFLGYKAKIIIQHHAEHPFTGIKKIAQKTASLFATAYFFPVKTIGKIWQEKGNIVLSKPIFTIQEGTSIFKPITTQNARLLTQTNGHPIYIWVGRLDANKHPLLAIKAFVKFLKIQPTAKLYMLFYRDELLDEITNYLAQNRVLATQIILVGKVAHSDMPNWYSSADFYISSSFKEGTSFTLSEAMSCGCVPIITSLITHIDMLGNNCGLLYQAGNEEELLAALIQSVTLEITLEKQKTLRQFKQYLSATAIANNIQSAIAKLI